MSGTQFSHFDMDHWLRVKAERSRLGLARNTDIGQIVPDHPFSGTSLVSRTRGQTYQVEHVKKDWLQGWFLTALMNVNGSHRVCIIQNLSSAAPWVDKAVAEFQEEFAVQH